MAKKLSKKIVQESIVPTFDYTPLNESTYAKEIAGVNFIVCALEKSTLALYGDEGDEQDQELLRECFKRAKLDSAKLALAVKHPIGKDARVKTQLEEAIYLQLALTAKDTDEQIAQNMVKSSVTQDRKGSIGATVKNNKERILKDVDNALALDEGELKETELNKEQLASITRGQAWIKVNDAWIDSILEPQESQEESV